jgi:hypothetical protein
MTRQLESVKPGDTIRYDGLGKLKLMAKVDGYVMLRRPKCMPFVRSVGQWNAMSAVPLAPQPQPEKADAA